jgi:hypothetical protein
MTQEYRITTQNVNPVEEGDCHLEPTDPIHALKATSIMGGLGAKMKLAQYNDATQQATIDKIQEQRLEARRQGIKPGSPAWYAMFPKPTQK